MKLEENQLIELYKSAIELWKYEGNLFWMKFNNFVLINTILVLAIGAGMGGTKYSCALNILLSVIGIIFCEYWFPILERSMTYHNFWIRRAREIERKFKVEYENKIVNIGKELQSSMISLSGTTKNILGIFKFLYLLVLFLSVVSLFISLDLSALLQ